MPNMEFNEDFAKSSRTHLNQSFEKTHRLFPDIQQEHRVNFYVIRVTTKQKNTGENLNWTLQRLPLWKTNILLMEEILYQLIGSLSPLFSRVVYIPGS